jgi:protein-tyrosine-phosphatase
LQHKGILFDCLANAARSATATGLVEQGLLSAKKATVERFKDDTANAVRAKGGSYHA